MIKLKESIPLHFGDTCSSLVGILVINKRDKPIRRKGGGKARIYELHLLHNPLIQPLGSEGKMVEKTPQMASGL